MNGFENFEIVSKGYTKRKRTSRGQCQRYKEYDIFPRKTKGLLDRIQLFIMDFYVARIKAVQKVGINTQYPI